MKYFFSNVVDLLFKYEHKEEKWDKNEKGSPFCNTFGSHKFPACISRQCDQAGNIYVCANKLKRGF